MKQGLLVAVGGAALLIAGLTGCSSDDKAGSKESSSSSKSESSEASTSAEAASETKVVIDGEDKGVTGNVYCASVGGSNTITIGEQGTGVVVILGNDDTSVTSVALGSTSGLNLAVGAGQGDATVEKDGKSYTVKGNAVGADLTNPTAGIQKKPFEIQVTCP